MTVRPGDASLAAPFTARSGGVAPCVDLVRQGRATLVASEQMFKILGLNCLCMAYVMSVQFLDGVKFGDTQMTVGGLITAGMFLALSRAAPSQTLAPSKPRCTIFTVYFFSSVFLQFAVHLTALWYTLDVAKAYTTVPPGAEFDTVPATTLTPDATDASDAPSLIAHTNATGGIRVCASPGVAVRSKPRQHCFIPGQHVHTDSHGGGQLRRSSALCYSV